MITAENSLAYKSLVEDPKEGLFEHQAENNVVTSTLPRSFASNPLEHFPQSNKAATLSKLCKTLDTETTSSSPLKILREKSFPIGKPRLKILPSVGSESVNSTTFLLDHDGENPCETPSYMANSEGNFTMSMKHQVDDSPKPSANHIEDNPLPLPPRDRSCISMNLPQKRHVRKYPLIIPATGIQRTLDKINQVTPVEEKFDVFPIPMTQADSQPPAGQAPQCPVDDDDDDVFENLKNDTKILQEFQQNINHSERKFTPEFIENNFPSSSQRKSMTVFGSSRTYENIEAFQKRFSYHDEADTASLHFESILENDDFDINISDDMVDGFCVFESKSSLGATSVQPEASRKPLKTASPTVIESKKLEFSQKYPKYKMPRNELASNALFNKIKESVENSAMSEEVEVELECDLKKSINHVSCEDLLDFSNVKPKGRELGAESDEVRIMSKMFGSEVTLQQCLSTLDFINWDLQKAIKLCKLQNQNLNLSLQSCFEQLEPHWDLNQIKKQ